MVCGASRMRARHWQGRRLSSRALSPGASPSCQPPPEVSVSQGWVYLQTPSATVNLQERNIKLKKRGDGGLAREGKGINPGSLLAFRAGAGLASPPGLTAPRTGPSPLQGQRASCPPSPFRQVPKPTAPAQAAGQGLAPHFLSHSPCQTAVFCVSSS